MQKPKVFNIDEGLLDTKIEGSDKLVYSVQYIPYDPFKPDEPKVLPAYKADYLARIAASMSETVRNQVLESYPEVQKLTNNLILERSREISLSSVSREIRSAIDSPVAIGEISNSVRTTVESNIEKILGSGTVLATTEILRPPLNILSEVPDTEQIRGVLGSDIGFLFLDQTRISPMGFAVGEHIMSLSLAPGEEVTIEQKVFSKREVTYEDLKDQEMTNEMEMSSSLTNELSEGLDNELSQSNRKGTTDNVGISGTVEGVGLNIGHTVSDNIDEADRNTSRTSVKNTRVASSKVSSKYRSQHKITFRVSTENRFESTSRRVFRNPNPYTPIDLQYFKILQRLQLTQERYGVRLCWAPAVRDPGSNIEKRLDAIKQEIYKQVENATGGPRPKPPTPPSTDAPQPVIVPKTVDADKFDWLWGNQRYDYKVVIDAPQGYTWDGDSEFIKSSFRFSFSGKRSAGANIVSIGGDGFNVKLTVHVGIADKGGEPTGAAAFSLSARFIPNSIPQADNLYNEALEQWKTEHEDWKAKDAAAKAAAKKTADAEWEEVRKEALKKINPVHETMAVMIANMFPSKYRDDIWEIDLWERLFDWKNATIKLYPSWWNDAPVRDIEASSVDFINASWARIFLPIRPEAEEDALRWIFGVTQSGQINQTTTNYIKNVSQQIKEYRKNHFGDEGEIMIEPSVDGSCSVVRDKSICLAKWDELLPTDGTHLEVLQATTTAADDDTRSRIEDADKLRKAEIKRIEMENSLRETAISGGLGTVQTNLQFVVGKDDEGSSS